MVVPASVAALALVVAPPAPPVSQSVRQALHDGATSAVVVVVDHGRVFASSSPRVAAPARERFRVGSITKTFTAALVLQLVQSGRVSLDATLHHYLPWAGGRVRHITIRELLDHRSGLQNYTDFPSWLTRADGSKTLRPRDILEFALSHPVLFAPGAAWRYSNTNYVALGLVIEAVTHRTYAQLLGSRILRPLHLDATELARTRTPRGLHDSGTNPWLPWAAGSLVSTASDLARFYSALLGGKLLSRQALAEMEQAVVTGGPLRERDGLGIFSTRLACGTFWGHDGGILDYYTQVVASGDGTRVLVRFARGPLTGWSPASRLVCP